MPRRKIKAIPLRKDNKKSLAAKASWRKRKKAENFGKYPKDPQVIAEYEKPQTAEKPKPSMPVTEANFVMIEEVLERTRLDAERLRKYEQDCRTQMNKAWAETERYKMANEDLTRQNEAQKVLLEKATVAFVAIFAPDPASSDEKAT